VSQLTIEGLWKQFGGNEVLRGLSLSIEQGAIVGLVATNGAGKTTLVNVLFGVYRKDRGTLRFEGRDLPQLPHDVVDAGLARTFQSVRLSPTMTVLETIRAVLVNRNCHVSQFVGSGRLTKTVRQKESELVSRFGLVAVAHSLVGSLSLAVQRKVEMARAVATGARFLFLDEPASGLSDTEEDELVASILELRCRSGITMLVIDHRIDFLRRIMDRLVFLHEGQVALDSSSSNIGAVLENPLMGNEYFGPKHLLKSRDQISAAVQDHPLRTAVLSISGAFIERGGVPVVKAADYSCHSASLSAVVGPNGGGKSSLLQCLAGILPAKSGIVRVDGIETNHKTLFSATSIAMVPENADVFPGLTVEENLRLGLHRGSADTWLHKLNLVTKRYPRLRETLLQSAGVLSGGERKMLAMARALIGEPRVLLVDEPSAGLAPAWVGRTYRTIAELVEQGVAAVVTESQEVCCDGYADRISFMKQGTLVDIALTRMKMPASASNNQE